MRAGVDDARVAARATTTSDRDARAMASGVAARGCVVIARAGRGERAGTNGRGRGGGRAGRGGGWDAGRRAARPSPSPSASERAANDVTRRNVDVLRDLVRATPRDVDEKTKTAYAGEGFRVVRCMPHLKRREADDAVSAGRVLVNGELVRPSRRVVHGDVVTLDGKAMDWEPYAQSVESELGDARFVYLKYNKPRGVVCTMSDTERTSMFHALHHERKALGKDVRLFPVGRLDKDSSGLVLLTNDGRVSDALLDPERKAEKTYDVDVDRVVSEADARTLARGVVISTTQQRDLKETVAATLPCEVTKTGEKSLRFVLKEGRNRQIRKMCEVLSYDVERLHRTRIDDVALGDLEVGGVEPLDEDEVNALSARVDARASTPRESSKHTSESRRRRRAIDANPGGWGAKMFKERDASA